VGEDDGRLAVERMRGYLREVLAATDTRETTVAHELQLVRAYLDLMKIALGERLSFAIHASAEALAVRIPPLSVLTLAENAVKHGIAAGGHAGVVSVAAEREGRAARIEVRDDGPGVAVISGSGLGLANTKARLRAMYGARATLSLETARGRGAVAAIEISRP
jgi:LytS/YehU family sensor histidine kinase